MSVNSPHIVCYNSVSERPVGNCPKAVLSPALVRPARGGGAREKLGNAVVTIPPNPVRPHPNPFHSALHS